MLVIFHIHTDTDEKNEKRNIALVGKLTSIHRRISKRKMLVSGLIGKLLLPREKMRNKTLFFHYVHVPIKHNDDLKSVLR